MIRGRAIDCAAEAAATAATMTGNSVLNFMFALSLQSTLDVPYNHYSMLRTVEAICSLAPLGYGRSPISRASGRACFLLERCLDASSGSMSRQTP